MAFLPITRDELLALWRTLFPTGYTVPIEQEGDGQGFDAFVQQAEQLARVAAAENITTQAYYLLPHSTQTAPESAGERRATGTLLVVRAAPATGSITLVREEWAVPASYPFGVDELVPLRAGGKIGWKLVTG